MRHHHRQPRAIVKTGDLDVLEHIALEDRPGEDDVPPPIAVQLLSAFW